MAGWVTDVSTYLAIFGFFYFFLQQLIKMASATINKPHATPKPDRFFDDNGYAYDWVKVFSVYDEADNVKLTEFQIKYSLGNILERLKYAGLEFKCFYSVQRDEIYCKIRADATRIKSEMDRVDYKVFFYIHCTNTNTNKNTNTINTDTITNTNK